MQGAAQVDAEMRSLAEAARAAARRMAAWSAADRRATILAMAAGLEGSEGVIVAANHDDLRSAQGAGLSPAMLDRLRLDRERLAATIAGARMVARQADVVGETLEEHTRPDGLRLRKVRVSLGVIAVIYESRPSVTVDAAALAIKAGSAVVLRGGSEAVRTNQALVLAVAPALAAVGAAGAVGLVPTTDRAAVRALLELDELVDLVIPRGGEDLVRMVASSTRIPVLKHAKGVCHVYVDRAADLAMAARIVENAKCQRPGVCNAMETLLVHRDVADAFLPTVGAALRARGVELRCDVRAMKLVPDAVPATDADWPAEYLDLILAVGVVDDLDAAIVHIDTHGSRHSDAIVTADPDAARRFAAEVDSAVVYVNASTRFTDGAEFGLGAEIGISTDKLHARGPCGAREITTYRWIVEGDGHVRR